MSITFRLSTTVTKRYRAHTWADSSNRLQNFLSIDRADVDKHIIRFGFFNSELQSSLNLPGIASLSAGRMDEPAKRTQERRIERGPTAPATSAFAPARRGKERAKSHDELNLTALYLSERRLECKQLFRNNCHADRLRSRKLPAVPSKTRWPSSLFIPNSKSILLARHQGQASARRSMGRILCFSSLPTGVLLYGCDKTSP